MKIDDFLEQPGDETTETDLEEIEKTASLLDALAEEDTLLDDLAKLAVLQDVAGIQKQAFLRAPMRQANKILGRAEKELKRQKILAEAKRIKAKAKKLTEEGVEPSSIPFIPMAAGAGVGALGTGVYFKKREERLLGEIASYYDAMTAKQKTK